MFLLKAQGNELWPLRKEVIMPPAKQILLPYFDGLSLSRQQSTIFNLDIWIYVHEPWQRHISCQYKCWLQPHLPTAKPELDLSTQPFWAHVHGRRAGSQKTQSKSTTPDPVYLILFWMKLLPSMKSMCSASGQGMSIKSGLMFWTCPKSIEQSCYTFEDRSGSRGTGFRTDDGFYLM